MSNQPTTYGDPVVCPFCGGDNIVFVNTFELLTTEQLKDVESHTCSLHVEEYQCRCCDNRSFWV